MHGVYPRTWNRTLPRPVLVSYLVRWAQELGHERLAKTVEYHQQQEQLGTLDPEGPRRLRILETILQDPHGLNTGGSYTHTERTSL
jgi:hypothetical protein